MELNSRQIIDDLKNESLSVYSARPNKVDIILEFDNINEFTELTNELGIKLVFTEVVKLNEEDLTSNIINDNEIRNEQIGRILEKEIASHNEEMKDMLRFIGKDRELRIFFSKDGIVYSWMLFNDDLFIDSKFELIETWVAEHEDEIEAHEESEAIKRRERLEEYFAALREFLLSSEDFLKCTNKELRKAFVFHAIKENEKLRTLQPRHILMTTTMEIVEEVWRTLKLKNNSII